MTEAEPRLSLGDTGEWVLRLQTRLQGLGLFDGAPDGSFDETTQAAVTQLQARDGLAADGQVDEQTWVTLARAEQQAGLQDPFAFSAEPAGVEPAGVEPAGVEPAGVDPETTPVGALSEDQQWRWDGERWQPKDQVAAADAASAEPAGSHLSADGHWVWDGNQWRPATDGGAA